MDGGSLPLVFVTVGTDHHPFDRLVGWIDDWLASGAKERVRCLIQTGTSKPPVQTEFDQYFGYQQMETFLAEASVVVCHGGPGTVMMSPGSATETPLKVGPIAGPLPVTVAVATLCAVRGPASA